MIGAHTLRSLTKLPAIDPEARVLQLIRRSGPPGTFAKAGPGTSRVGCAWPRERDGRREARYLEISTRQVLLQTGRPARKQK